MSSSLRRRPWSLRARLIAEQLVLLALVCVITGVITLVGLRAFLLDRLDTELTEASTRAAGYIERGPPPGPNNGEPPPDGQPPPPPRGTLPPSERPDRPIDAPGQGPGTINALIEGTTVINANRQTSTGVREDLPQSVYDTLIALPVDGKARIRDLG